MVCVFAVIIFGATKEHSSCQGEQTPFSTLVLLPRLSQHISFCDTIWAIDIGDRLFFPVITLHKTEMVQANCGGFGLTGIFVLLSSDDF